MNKQKLIYNFAATIYITLLLSAI